MNDFPGFIPAKPKGGIAAEIAAAKAQAQPKLLPDEPKGVPEAPSKRKRRTAAEMASANGGGNAFAIYCQIVELLEPVDKRTRMLMFKMLMDNHT